MLNINKWVKVPLVAAVGALLVSVLVPVAPPAVAADASSFNPAHIVSDANFYDGDAMSEAEIQAFLESAGPTRCATGTTCLKDFATATWTRPADPMCGSYVSEGYERAAHIIMKVALACGISPKVLLVTLQKEQSLVTHSSPSASRYDRATGYACPDTAPCDTEYAGFYNQVYKSAWQFKRYLNPPGTTKYYTWYPVGAVTSVRYSPNAACGGSPLRIQNAATAALYYYTPYQPNAAALANLYGTGDGCSAYGNRNFWRLYSDWFGNPAGNPYGSFDSATANYRGVTISGWSVSPTTSDTSYVWVNVDGVGQAYQANSSRPWFDAVFPGYGPNHGFDIDIPTTPGAHEVCVYGTLELIGCRYLDVPKGAGNLDAASGVRGGIRITGWSADFTSASSSYMWVNVDGTGGPWQTNVDLPWLNALYPGIGTRQGFDLTIPATPGAHEVCVSGAESSIGCRTVTVPAGSGALDAVTSVPGGVRIAGWAVDYLRTDFSYIWANVNGVGGPYATKVDLPWLAAYLPGAGTRHGFDQMIYTANGRQQVCVSGPGGALGCSVTTVTRQADGSLDAVTSVPGGIRVTGWSLDLRNRSTPGYVWIDVSGSGGPAVADKNVAWMDALYPGAGVAHGFDETISKPPGTYRVCVTGSEALLGCSTVTVT